MPGFVKLDAGMLDSTLWLDLDGRNVFLTALLMAEPHELAEPVPQLHVDSLEPTGWTLPPGWYGLVRAAGPGIVRRSGLRAKRGMEALRRLGEPDPGSRSNDFDGRRLVRVDGGYLVVNFMRYRDRDYSAAERMRKLRERQREQKSVTALRRNDRNVHPNVTQQRTEAEAEADTTTTDASRPTRSTSDGYSGVFERTWAIYPRRAGGNPKRRAIQAWSARIKAGATADEIHAGTERYARFCDATGKTGTEYVKQAATFFGPDEHFREAWDAPASADGQPFDPCAGLIDVTEEMPRSDGLGGAS